MVSNASRKPVPPAKPITIKAIVHAPIVSGNSSQDSEDEEFRKQFAKE